MRRGFPTVIARLRSLLSNPRENIGEARKYNIATQDRWEGRASAAVDLWAQYGNPDPTPRVGDLGAGSGIVGRLLASRLPYETSYAAFDLHPQNPQIRQLDVRDGLPADHVTVAFALGLIEYLPEEDPILERLAQYADHVVLSYVARDDARKDRNGRTALGWLRHQTNSELDQALRTVGYHEIARDTADDYETTLRLLASPS